MSIKTRKGKEAGPVCLMQDLDHYYEGTTNKHNNRCNGFDIAHKNLGPACGETVVIIIRNKYISALAVSVSIPKLLFDLIQCDRYWGRSETLTDSRGMKGDSTGGFMTKRSRDNIHLTACGVQWNERNKHQCTKCRQGVSNPHKWNEHQKT